MATPPSGASDCELAPADSDKQRCAVCRREFSGKTARERLIRHVRRASKSTAPTARAQEHEREHIQLCARIRGRITSGSARQRRWYAAHRRELLLCTDNRQETIRDKAIEQLLEEWHIRRPRPTPPAPPNWNALEIDKSNPFYYVEQVLGLHVGETVASMGTIAIRDILRQSLGIPGAREALYEASHLSKLPHCADAYFGWKKATIMADGWEEIHEDYKRRLLEWERELDEGLPSSITEEDIQRRVKTLEATWKLPSRRRRHGSRSRSQNADGGEEGDGGHWRGLARPVAGDLIPR